MTVGRHAAFGGLILPSHQYTFFYSLCMLRPIAFVPDYFFLHLSPIVLNVPIPKSISLTPVWLTLCDFYHVWDSHPGFRFYPVVHFVSATAFFFKGVARVFFLKLELYFLCLHRKNACSTQRVFNLSVTARFRPQFNFFKSSIVVIGIHYRTVCLKEHLSRTQNKILPSNTNKNNE